MKWGKRGQTLKILTITFEFLFAGIVLLMLWNLSSPQESIKSDLEMVYAANHLETQWLALEAYDNGNVVYDDTATFYPDNYITIKNGEITVFKDPEKKGVTRQIPRSEHNKDEIRFNKPFRITLSRQGSEIKFGEFIQQEKVIESMECPSPLSIINTQILIDPVAGDDVRNNELLANNVNALYPQSLALSHALHDNIENKLASTGDSIVLSLNTIEGQKSIKYYYRKDDSNSNRLGCLIANSLIQSGLAQSASKEEIPSELPAQDPKRVPQSTQGHGILIELSGFSQEDYPALSRTITDSLNDFVQQKVEMAAGESIAIQRTEELTLYRQP